MNRNIQAVLAGIALITLALLPGAPRRHYYGGYYSRSYGSYTDDYGDYRRGSSKYDNIFLAIIGTIVLVRVAALMLERPARYSSSGGAGAAPDAQPQARRASGFLLPNGAVAPKAEATLAVMKGLAGRDQFFDPEKLEAEVRDVFMRVQQARQARDLEPVRDVMMPALHDEYKARALNLKATRRSLRLEGLQVEHVDFVHVRRPEADEGCSFTALITASAAEQLTDDLSGARIGGDDAPAAFQEFWTFYRLCDSWALARVDKAGDGVALNAPNLPAVPPHYAQAERELPPAAVAAQPQAPAAPAPDRQKLEIAATLAFESVYEAWGKNDASLLKPDFISGAALQKLSGIMKARRDEGLSFELNSFFARRAEVVMGAPEEFTARITATALRAMARKGKVIYRDQAPQPFTEYWVFSRDGGDWKLSDILPRTGQEGSDPGQDGAPGPAQIEWYWEAANG